jgi:hypothetical protein
VTRAPNSRRSDKPELDWSYYFGTYEHFFWARKKVQETPNTDPHRQVYIWYQSLVPLWAGATYAHDPQFSTPFNLLMKTIEMQTMTFDGKPLSKKAVRKMGALFDDLYGFLLDRIPKPHRHREDGGEL